MLTHDRSKRKAASLCHESLRYILYIIWGSLTNLKIAFFLHQRYTKLHHSKVWNIQTREMNTAFSSHNVTGFKGYLPRSPSSYPVRVVWNDNDAEIIYMLSTRGAKRGSNYIYFRFQSLSLPLSMIALARARSSAYVSRAQLTSKKIGYSLRYYLDTRAFTYPWSYSIFSHSV